MPKMVVQGASEGSAEFWSAFALGRAIGLPGQREPEASQRHVLVGDVATARGALKTIDKNVKRSRVVAIDIEGDLRPTGRLSLIQIGLEDESVFLFDVQECPALLDANSGASGLSLRSLLCGPAVKILHDCRNDARALKGQFDITMTRVWDTQVSHAILEDKDPTVHHAGLNVILQKYAGAYNGDKTLVRHRPGVWEQRPLPPLLLRYAAQDVQHLIKVYRKMHRMIVQKNLLERSMTATASRLALAQSASGSVNQEAGKSSQELLEHTADAFWTHVMSLNSHRELEDRDLFTKAFREWKGHEALQGREWRGGPGTVLFQLVRKKAIKQVKNSSTIVFGSSGGASAALERVLSSRERIAENKHGIAVSDIDFDQVVSVGASCSKMIHVRNFAPQERWLETCQLLNHKHFEVVLSGGPVPIRLEQNSTITLDVKFRPSSGGVFKDTLSLVFAGAACGGKFTIGRFFEAQCGDADLLDDIRPSAPFSAKRKAQAARFPGVEIPPPLPENYGPRREGPNLRGHDIPTEWRQVQRLGEEDDKLEVACAALEDACTALQASDKSALGVVQKAYIHLHQRLLWSEEMQLKRDLAHFDLTGDEATIFSPDGRHLRLSVAGLAEKRPSLLKGDFLNARLCGDKDKYKGRVDLVEREDVLLLFDTRLHDVYIKGRRVEIQFILNRGPWRLFYQGLQHVTPNLAKNVLFPSKPLPGSIGTWNLLQRSPFNRSVRENPHQWRAVSCIVDRSHLPYPYIVFGPPGTGKTTTLVEAILQFVDNQPSLNVLVCAPTNTAADVLCSRLTQRNVSEMLRLMAFSRNPLEVDSKILPYTNLTKGPSSPKDGQFAEPSANRIEQMKIVVTTLAMASRLINIGVPAGHFDLIVIDEAGQAMEAEIVAVVAPLQIPQVVLGGDPRQLGPVIHSPAAKKHGLSMSLLERLLYRPMYAKSTSGEHNESSGFDPQYITMLVRNYRSHAQLLKEPNILFYHGALESWADPMITNCRLHWEGLPKQGVPLLWHGIQGREEREAKSPSWFNRDEAVCVLQHVQSLMRMRPDCRQEHIGIITPYNKQAHKITRLLKGEDLKEIKVGSTEMFQGQERQIIIISTVRSSLEMLSFDVKHKIGFLNNPKRFNVAVTRASSLLIIVGNPNVFVSDPHWGKVLRSCQELGAYKGIAVQGPEDVDQSTVVAAQNALLDMLLDEDPDAASPEMRQGTIPMPEFDS